MVKIDLGRIGSMNELQFDKKVDIALPELRMRHTNRADWSIVHSMRTELNRIMYHLSGDIYVHSMSKIGIIVDNSNVACILDDRNEKDFIDTNTDRFIRVTHMSSYNNIVKREEFNKISKMAKVVAFENVYSSVDSDAVNIDDLNYLFGDRCNDVYELLKEDIQKYNETLWDIDYTRVVGVKCQLCVDGIIYNYVQYSPISLDSRIAAFLIALIHLNDILNLLGVG